MAKVKIVLDSDEVRRWLNAPDMQAVVLEQARRVAGRAGAGYEADVKPGKVRAQARVEAISDEAKLDNLENNTLLKAMGGR